MRFTFRRRLMASYLLLVVVIGGAIYGYMAPSLRRQMVAETRAALLSEARLARLMASRSIADLRQDAPEVAGEIAREVRSRVTVMTAAGEVVGDSEVSAGELGELENHLSRPEVRQALEAGEGDAVRYSSTLRTSMMYVAFPFISAAGESCVLRLALPLSAVEKTTATVHTTLGISLVLAFLLSLVLSYILSNLTSRSLRDIASVALDLAKGRFTRRAPGTGGGEVAELATALNVMASRIEEQLDTLSAEKARLDTILRGMWEGLLVTAPDGRVSLVNTAFVRMFALRHEVEGKPLIDLTRHPALHDSFRAVAESRHERFDEIVLPAPEEKTLLTHWVPLAEREELRGVVAVFHDITDQKKLEKMRRDFVANVSHELRTPLAVIRGYAETLLSGVLESDRERAARFVEIIHTHSERLTTLVSDLLALSELESGGISLQLMPVPLDAAVGHAVLLLEEKAAAKGITIETADVAQVAALADPGRLEQVLVNLIDNAIKYTPEGGIISISAAEAGEMVELRISDTGIGVPAKDLPRIFERFYRVDSARSRDLGGTGLGLSIVKHIVQLHGGTVSVESSPGNGSTFSVSLRRG